MRSSRSIGDEEPAIWVDEPDALKRRAMRAIANDQPVVWGCHFVDGHLVLATTEEKPGTIINNFFEENVAERLRRAQRSRVVRVAIVAASVLPVVVPLLLARSDHPGR